MLYTKIDSNKYMTEFKERFSNFAQKAPILLSFVVSEDKVQVIHENSGTVYDFDWDFTVPVKSFIHEIKQILSDNHYPRIARTIVSKVRLTPEEQAELLEQGVSTGELPTHKDQSSRSIFRIDKVIALRDIFIIQDEDTFETYRYKMNYSSIFFLKGYRTGRFKSLDEAGDFFFNKSELLNEIKPSA